MEEKVEEKVEEKIAHLGFIQGVINRMANNSFLLKGWAITIVAAAFSIYEKKPEILSMAYLPILLFWLMDSYFFYQEKLYRKLYNMVRKSQLTTDFSLNTSTVKSSINYNWYKPCFFLRPSISLVYAALLITVYLFSKDIDIGEILQSIFGSYDFYIKMKTCLSS